MAIFSSNLWIFFFAQNIDCGYALEPSFEAVLTNTHNQCFRAKMRKNEYPGKPHFSYMKVGCKGYALHGHVFMMI